MKYQLVIKTVLVSILIFYLPSVSLLAANFWISKHGVPGVGSQTPAGDASIPQINRLAGSGTGSFYIWAKPDEGKTLKNWSLNVVSTNPSAVMLTNSWVAPFNATLNPPAVGTAAIRRWEYFEEPIGELVGNPPTASIIGNINGFSLFNNEGMGKGIGANNLASGLTDPFYNSATGAWLLAKIDYLVATEVPQDPFSDIFLQIGTLGMTHLGDSSTAGTNVVFGDLMDLPALNAGNPNSREKNSIRRELRIVVGQSLAPVADFNSDDLVSDLDLNIWQSAYGPNTDGDADGDGDTDGKDLLAWQRQFGGNVGTPLFITDETVTTPESLVRIVPEPGTIILIVLAAWMCFLRSGFRSLNSRSAKTRFARATSASLLNGAKISYASGGPPRTAWEILVYAYYCCPRIVKYGRTGRGQDCR